jgi:hypothetical protein
MFQVPAFNRSQPQYAYSVAAIIVVLVQLAVEVAVLSYRHQGVCKLTFVSGASAWALELTAGTGMQRVAQRSIGCFPCM